jgi:hypothetical protein
MQRLPGLSGPDGWQLNPDNLSLYDLQATPLLRFNRNMRA